MAKISLIRVDSPQDNEINLPTGETTIGRGSVLGCEDKRVSRSHGLLQISDDGSIALVSLHVNPCFYKVQNLNSFAVLVKGQSKILSHGDTFSLLPSSFQYRIVVKAEDPESTAADSELMVGNKDNPSLTTNNDNKNKEPSQIQTVSEAQQIIDDIQDIENDMPDSLSTPTLKTKRVLPGWLTNLPGPSRDSESPNPAINVPAVSVARKRTATQIANNGEELEKRIKREIKEEKGDDLDSTIVKEGSSETDPLAEPSTSNLHLQSFNNDIQPTTTVKDGYEAKYGEVSSAKSPGELNLGMRPNQSTSNDRAREPCVYGAACYRKNPHHTGQFSHPGDADFEAHQNLPECPYGLSCYRKSLQHRKDYKHTQPPSLPPQSNADPPSSNANYYNCNITYNICPNCQHTTSIDLTEDDKPEPED